MTKRMTDMPKPEPTGGIIEIPCYDCGKKIKRQRRFAMSGEASPNHRCKLCARNRHRINSAYTGNARYFPERSR
jgi:hypothetical protein